MLIACAVSTISLQRGQLACAAVWHRKPRSLRSMSYASFMLFDEIFETGLPDSVRDGRIGPIASKDEL